MQLSMKRSDAGKKGPNEFVSFTPRGELFHFLKEQWGNLFGAKYDVLLYDLTSTYFESDPLAAGSDSKTCPHENGERREVCNRIIEWNSKPVLGLVIKP